MTSTVAEPAKSRVPKLKTAAFFILAIAAVSAWPIASSHFHKTPQNTVEFSRDIQPILNQNCVACHGGVRQKNGVSFIFREEALGIGKSGRRTIVPGNPDASELIARVTSTDPEDAYALSRAAAAAAADRLAPPMDQGGSQVAGLLGVCTTQAAALAAGEACRLGAPTHGSIYSGAAGERRVATRLPRPTSQPCCAGCLSTLPDCRPPPQEEAAYLADSSPDAYEKQVDRLLASPRYGERWASMWLDLARYADTKGYEKDRERPGVWPYRDWVIDAFNRNLPYDQFMIKQLAGDLLPNATFEDRIATSFHRQTPNNDEGGTDDEEFRMVAVMDRVATTWSVLNGVTMNCVQCHSHPYDPIRHTDYYKSMAFFNTQNDADLDDDSPRPEGSKR